MDANEIIKHAPELLKGGAAVAGALKFTDVIKAFLGPATAEIAERFQDQVRLYRFGRQLECLRKAEKMAKDAGFTPKAVPIKLLFPLLEGASLEENEDLHTMWAALLANAAAPENPTKVRPGFIAILKQMAPDEGLLLKVVAAIADEEPLFLSSNIRSKDALDRAMMVSNMRKMALVEERLRHDKEDQPSYDLRFETCAMLLENAGLIHTGTGFVMVSALGRTFLESCSPPESKVSGG
jgi:hypothetical protein